MQRLEGQIVLSPSDLVGHLACAHLTALEWDAAQGIRKRPVRIDPALDVIQARGLEREEHFLEAQRAAGRRVVIFKAEPPRTVDGLRSADRGTLDAMRSGAGVIAQATFFDGRWQGRADFLLRVDRPSELGRWSYEPADAKLSRIVKGAAILQLCSYAEHLTRLQGLAPENIHVITGDGHTHGHRLDDYAAYFRRVRRRFEDALASGRPADVYPEPVEHCRICRWWAECADRRRADDHLSLVAGITRVQTAQLREAAVTTVAALGGLANGASVAGVKPSALETLRAQARLQLEQRADGQQHFELIPPVAGDEARGLAALPEPSPGDVFLDLEADPWAADEGLEYLFGTVIEENGAPVYRPAWAHTPEQERIAFDELMAFVAARRRQWPEMHVYHYGGYESGALKRLMGRYAIREDELDELLRGKVLVDLYSILRQGVRVSEESYSLKRVEKLYMPRREGPATHPGYALVAYEEWLRTREQRILDEIAAYNRDDCISVWKLQAWLEQQRTDAQARFGMTWARPQAPVSTPSEAQQKANAETARRIERLREGVPLVPEQRNEDQRARWLLSTLLEWHRREEKPQWWRYFFLRERPLEELVAASDALGELEYEGPREVIKRSQVHRYRYDPEQEHPFSAGDDAVDPADEGNPGEVHFVDRTEGIVDLRRGTGSQRPHPRALIERGPLSSIPLRDALGRVADHVIEHGFEEPGAYRGVRDLLLRRPPRIRGVRAGARLANEGEDLLAAARRLAAFMDDSYLPVQGPPGSGKTYTGARMVLSLVRQGARVGITANAHKAVANMIEALQKAAREERVTICIAQKPKSSAEAANGVEALASNEAVAEALAEGRCVVAAGTPWLFAAPAMQGLIDVLFVDEAGQMSLATAVAAGSCARSIVLLGDPNQLPQVTQGTHPEGAEKSALEHVIGEAATLPAHMGLFLDETWRLHPKVCTYISDAFYASRLTPHESTAVQRLAAGSRLGEGAGIVFIPVEHTGRGVRSPEEAAVAAEVVRELLRCAWSDRHGNVRGVRLGDVLLVAPYNVQVAELGREVERAIGSPPRAGTVDKFQGQEGAVAIYSMATSSAEDAPRDLEFLYSRNRLNVALSRARVFAVLLCSPRLLDVQCRTPELMRALNAFCRFLEGATSGS